MAGIKIVDLPPLGRDLASTDLLELSLAGGTGSRKITGQEIMNTSKLNIGTTAITSGTVGRVLFEGTGNVVQESANLTWDNTNGIFNVVGRINAKSTTAQPSSLIVEGTTGVNSGNAGFVVRTGTGYQATFFAADSLAGQGIAGLGIFSGSATPFGLQTGAPNGAFFIHNNGNIGIGTSYTNAGFRLDVNGTARVQSNGTFGITNTRILTIRPEDTSGAYGNSCSIRGGVSNGRLDFYSATNITELRDNIILLTSATGPSVQVGTGSINLNVGGTRLQVAPTTGNVLIGTTTDDGFRLDVNGTARVGGNVTVSLNQNGQTKTTLSNTTSGTSSRVDYILTSDGGAGEANFGKFSSTTTTYKILAARDTFLYNNPTAGDISILNDFATGRIKFAAGGASTAQMTLFSTGNLAINTTTDAGFRLDVNGTARVQGALTVTGTQILFNGAFYNTLNDRNHFGGAISISTFLRIGTNANTVASAILQADSTTKGFLPPRMTQTERNAIASPAIGLEIYQTDATEGKYIYKSSGWTYIG